MTCISKTVSLVALTMLVASAARAEPPVDPFTRSAPVAQCRTVHGRLRIYNGTASFRIWVIGTHRMLRVVKPDGQAMGAVEELPKALIPKVGPRQEDAWLKSVFGNFRVCAFTRQQVGVMQSVTLDSASNIHVVEDTD